MPRRATFGASVWISKVYEDDLADRAVIKGRLLPKNVRPPPLKESVHARMTRIRAQVGLAYSCFINVHPDSHVYISASNMKDKGSSALSLPEQNSLFLEIFHGEKDNVASSKGTVVLEDLGMDLETVKTISSVQMQRLVSDDMVAYDINIPVDNERRNVLRCTLTVIRGRADLYHGYGVEFLRKPFVESLHGKHVDKFCMNVVYFSFFFGSVSSVMSMIDIILSNNIDMTKAMRWLDFPEKVSVDSNGYNFLHYVAVCYPDTHLVHVVQILMSISLPESHADISKEVNKKYVKWIDTVTDKGETPLSLSILYANESAFHRFMNAEPSLSRILENGILAERYTNVNYAHLSQIKQFRDEEELKESAAKIQLTLKNKIVEMQQKKAAILQELLEVPIVPCAVEEVDKRQIREPFEMGQSGVQYFVATREIERRQFRELLEMRQSVVRYFSAVGDVEQRQIRERFQLRQSVVRYVPTQGKLKASNL
ncbi:hypothetical protein CYMTET_6172 [Cymbomonas tetramitiformis]|uniref:Uncharacterized protein n=1 Tax=Cymbomonas tetramitiformis TaxID=36881 RepID=A0AAE0GXS5_9CHLO|nr:hypothetical protein CYMTET_6172 [Cymbomonas tetramitiformis]